MQCKIGKVIGNLHALQQLLPETVDSVAVVQYMPTLLLSNMKKVSSGFHLYRPVLLVGICVPV